MKSCQAALKLVLLQILLWQKQAACLINQVTVLLKQLILVIFQMHLALRIQAIPVHRVQGLQITLRQKKSVIPAMNLVMR